MAKRLRKNFGSCVRELNIINGKVTFKIKNTKKCKSAQNLLDSVKTNKIVVK